MSLPVDPIMLLSVVNLKLRDQYKDLDALCAYSWMLAALTTSSS